VRWEKTWTCFRCSMVFQRPLPWEENRSSICADDTQLSGGQTMRPDQWQVFSHWILRVEACMQTLHCNVNLGSLLVAAWNSNHNSNSSHKARGCDDF
jgi:hypothetical protein